MAAEHIPLGVAPSACPSARSLLRNAAQAVRSPQRMPACIKAVAGVGAAAQVLLSGQRLPGSRQPRGSSRQPPVSPVPHLHRDWGSPPPANTHELPVLGRITSSRQIDRAGMASKRSAWSGWACTLGSSAGSSSMPSSSGSCVPPPLRPPAWLYCCTCACVHARACRARELRAGRSGVGGLSRAAVRSIRD